MRYIEYTYSIAAYMRARTISYYFIAEQLGPQAARPKQCYK